MEDKWKILGIPESIPQNRKQRGYCHALPITENKMEITCIFIQFSDNLLDGGSRRTAEENFTDVSTISTSPWAVWTCIIKERNTRKYEYVIQLTTIEITSACIL